MRNLVLLFTLFITSCSFAGKHQPLPSVQSVEIERYVGKWNAIAALPQFFTRKCVAQTAEYEILGPGEISVLNTCIQEKKNTTIEGQAVVVDSETNAKLEVTFNNFWTRLFRVKGDYVIVNLDPDYEYVFVGSGNRKSMWLMSRSESMPDDIYNKYIDQARSLGFPVEKLEKSKF